jgi:Ku protein
MVPEEAGKRPYTLLAVALEETGHFGIANVTMHNREYTVILRPDQGGIVLHTMYYTYEVRHLESFGRPNVEAKPAEVKIAHQLIQAMSAKFDLEKYHDTFEDNVRELIKAKLEEGKSLRYRSRSWHRSPMLCQPKAESGEHGSIPASEFRASTVVSNSRMNVLTVEGSS